METNRSITYKMNRYLTVKIFGPHIKVNFKCQLNKPTKNVCTKTELPITGQDLNLEKAPFAFGYSLNLPKTLFNRINSHGKRIKRTFGFETGLLNYPKLIWNHYIYRSLK